MTRCVVHTIHNYPKKQIPPTNTHTENPLGPHGQGQREDVNGGLLNCLVTSASSPRGEPNTSAYLWPLASAQCLQSDTPADHPQGTHPAPASTAQGTKWSSPSVFTDYFILELNSKFLMLFTITFFLSESDKYDLPIQAWEGATETEVTAVNAFFSSWKPHCWEPLTSD